MNKIVDRKAWFSARRVAVVKGIDLASLKATVSYRVLEPRTAFDAALVTTVASEIGHEADQTAAAADAHDQQQQSTDAADGLVQALETVPAVATPATITIVFIDGAVHNRDQLLAGIPDSAEIVVLDSTRDGVEQIASYLAGRTGVDSIHIMSHGDAGRIYLGNAELTQQSVNGEHSDELAAIGRALTVDGDILVYGCDVAAGSGGQQLIDAIAAKTGADVAASTDDTGWDEAGGDWTLEASSGAIETPALQIDTYRGILSQTNTGAWTIPAGGSTASFAGGGATVTVGWAAESANSSWAAATNQTLNTIAAFSPAVQGTASLGLVFNWDTTPESSLVLPIPLASTDGGTGLLTISFSQAVTNPIIHIDRLGGNGGFTNNTYSNSSLWTLLNGATLTELAGATSHFDTTSTTIVRTPNQLLPNTSGTESTFTTTAGTAAGSIRVNGTFAAGTTIQFRLSGAGVEGAGSDGFEIKVTYDLTPTATNDTFTTAGNTPVTINVRSNDTDPSGDVLTVTRVAGTSITAGGAGVAVTGGVVTLNAGGNLIFTPTAGYAGSPSFTYTVADANGGASTAIVSGTVANIVPVAVDDGPITVTPGVLQSLAVLANDTDANSHALSVSQINGTNVAVGGSITLASGTVVTRNADGTFGVVMAPGSSDTETFAYTISDGFGGVASANVTLARDSDGDGVANSIDIDDDNDGLLDTVEGQTPINLIANGDFSAGAANWTNSGGWLFGQAYAQNFDDPTTPERVLSQTLSSLDTAVSNGFLTFSFDIHSNNLNDSAAATASVATLDFRLNGQTFLIARNDNTNIGRLELQGATEFATGSATTFIVSTTRTQFTTVTVRVPYSGPSSAVFAIAMNSNGDDFRVDNLSLLGASFVDTDSDGISDHLDIDSDNDGITDNVEAQTTAGYIAPSGTGAAMVDTDNDGLDDAYDATDTTGASGSLGLTPGNTDSADVADYLDSDSDNDGKLDITERGDGQPTSITSTIDTDGDGLLNIFEAGSVNDGFDVNDSNRTATTLNLAGVPALNATGSNAVPLTTDLLFRDVNNLPVDGNETNSVTEDVTLSIANGAVGDLLLNATDIDGDTLTITGYTIAGIAGAQTVGSLVTIPGVGAIQINANGSYSFAPVNNYAGAIPVITYTVSDGNGGTDSSTLTLSMIPVNDSPVDGNETNSVTEDVTLSIANGAAGDLLNNATDIDGDTLTITGYTIAGIAGAQTVGSLVTIPGVGAIQINANGSYSFAPVNNYAGAIPVITYTVSDGNGGTDSSTLQLTMVPVNDAPAGANATVTTNEDTAYTFSAASFGFTDPNDSPADTLQAVVINTLPATGTLTLSGVPVTVGQSITAGSIGGLVWTPPANVNGTAVAAFTFSVVDIGGIANGGANTDPTPNTITINVTAVNDAPIVDLNSSGTAADTDRDFNTTFNTGSPTAIVVADTDADVFDTAENDISRVTITLAGVTLASTDIVTIAGQSFQSDVNATFNNVTIGGSSVNIVYVASTHTVTISNATGATNPIAEADLDTLVRGVAYQSTALTQPPSNRTLSFTATDTYGATSAAAVATVTFLPPPVAVNDTFSTVHGTPVAIAVLANDIDPQNDPLVVTHVNGTAIVAGGPSVAVTGGVVTLDASGNIVFTPNANFAGPTSFTYRVGDGAGGQDTATITGVVTNVAPVLDLNSGISSGEQVTNGANPGATGWTELANAVGSAPATSGGATGMYVFNNNDSGIVTLTQSAISGWSTGSAPSGAAQLTFDFQWFRNGSGATGGAVMEVQIGGVTYATITSTGIASPATITYSNGGSGAVSGSSTTVNISPDTTVPITLNLPTSVAATGDLVFSYTSSNPNKIDFAIDSISVVATADQTAGNNFSATYTENGSPVSIADADNDIRDSDDTNMELARITLTNPQTGDRLLVNGSAGTTGSIGGITWTRTNDLVTFTGSASEADYAAAIRLVQFENTSETPATTPRVINTTVNDGSLNSNSAVTTVTIDRAPDPVNDVFSGNEAAAISGNVLTNDADTGDGPAATPLAIVTGPANGTLTSFDTTTGAFVYTPASNDFFGTDTFTYRYTDADGDSRIATVTLTINPVNDAPVNTLPATIGPVAEDGTLAITGVSVGDVDGDPLTTTVSINHGILNIGATGGATVSGSGTGTVTLSGTAAQINTALAALAYVPTADFNGSSTFEISTTDGTVVDSDSRTITVTAIADIATDTVVTNEDTAVAIHALDNDTFENADAIVMAVMQGTNGSVSIGPGGVLTYTPNANFNGADSFTYTVTSGGVTETITVDVTVNPVADAPVNTVPAGQTAIEDTNRIIAGVSVSDADVGSLTTTLSLPAGAGTLTVLTGGGAIIGGNGTGIVILSGTAAQINTAIAAITYAPTPDFNGATVLTVTTNDGATTDRETVDITVTPVADITNDAVSTTEDAARTFNVLTGTNGATADTFEGAPAVTAVTQPLNGSVSFAANGALTYTPNTNFNGTDTFTYTVTSGGVTETATVTVTVAAVNDAPLSTVPAAQLTTEDTVIVFSAAAGNAIVITDVDSNVTTTLTVANGRLSLGSASGVTVTGNGTGTVTVSGSPAAITAALNGLTFAPTADWNGATTLNVSTSDGVAPPTLAAVGITVTPVVDIAPNSASTAEDTAATFNVLTNDSFENAGRVVSSVTQPAHGSVTFLANGQVTYTPTSNTNGPDSFTYTVTSGGVTETTTVTLTVNPVNDAPTGSTPFPRTSIDGAVASYNLGGFFSDLDGDALTFSATNLPAGLTIDPATGRVSGTIDGHASQGGTLGVYAVSITATDPSGLSVTRVFNWTVTNPGPVATNDTFTGSEDVAITGNVRTNDSDPDGDTLSVLTTPAVAPQHGTLVLQSNGTFTYTPDANYNGPDSFTYTLVDADGATTTAVVSLIVNPANDSPVIAAPASVTATEDTPFSFTGANAISFSDVDSAAITTDLAVTNGTLTLASLPGVTITGSGTNALHIVGSPADVTAALAAMIYQAAADYNGAATLNITSTDGIGSSTASIALSVGAVADIAADAVTTSEDAAISFNVLTGSNGATADTFEGAPSVTGFTQPANGSVTVDAAGNVTYTPNTNFNGADSFSYTVTSGGVTETTTVTITVDPANDAPTQVLPPAQNGTEDVAVVFSGANGNQIVIADIDSAAVVTTTLSVPQGSLSAIATLGVTITNNGTGAVTLSGTPAAITAALNGLTYTPVADMNGSVSLAVSTNDGIAAPANGAIAINLAAVADIANNATTTAEEAPAIIAVLGNDTFENPGRAVTAVTNGANGSVAINPDGTVTYTPNANFNGADSFTYTVTSGGVAETATVIVTVTPVNDAPITTVPAAQATFEDTGLSFSNVNGNAITVGDIDGDALTTTLSVTNGTLSLATLAGLTVSGDGTGSITLAGSASAINAALNGLIYNPTADYNGAAVLTVATNDGAVTTGGTVALTVTPVVDIAADAVTTSEDTPIAITVLANDNFENAGAAVTGVTHGAHGTVSIGVNGIVTYTPNANFNGTDTFTYTVTSGGVTEIATVTVTVDPVNDAPVTAVPLLQTTNEDTAVVFSSGNGNAIVVTDIDGDTLTVTLTGANGLLTLGSTAGVTFSGNGTASVVVTGSATAITAALNNLNFAPAADYNGPAAIVVTTTDGQATSSGTVAINVTPVADITADTVMTSEDTPVTFNVLAGTNGATADSFESTAAVVSSVTQGASGIVSFLGDGTLVYTPDANFHGTDTFSYTVTSGGVTETTTVTVLVGDTNDVPTTAGLANRNNLDGQVISLDVSAVFADQDGDALTYTITGLPPGLSYNPTTGLISGTIDAGASQGGIAGVYTVSVTATDGLPGGNVTTNFSWSVVNPGPTAHNDTATLSEDSAATPIAVLANDTDPDGDPLVVTAAAAGNGIVTINGDGSISYTPNADFNGTDTITYQISDGNGGTSSATVTVTVTAVNDAPETTGLGDLVDVDSQSVNIDISNAFSDLDGDNLTYAISGLPPGLSFNPLTGQISGTIDPNASDPSGDQPYPITVTASDGHGGSVATTFTWRVMNIPPASVDDSVTTPEDSPVIATVLANDVDPDGDPLIITHINGSPISIGSGAISTAHGQVELSTDAFGNQVLIYTPDANFNGVDQLVYTTNDGNSGIDTATLTITVVPRNDAPVADTLADLASADSDTVSIDVSAYFHDIDAPNGDTLTFAAIGLPPGLSMNAAGVITGTIDPSASQSGPYTVLVQATDAGGLTVSESFTWSVSNPAPTANDDARTLAEDVDLTTTAATGILPNDTDPDHDPLTVAAINGDTGLVGQQIAGSNGGLFTVSADGSYTFQHNGDFEDLQGSETRTTIVSYTVTDGNGGLNTATLSITITGTNDAPVATDIADITTIDSAPLTLNAAAAFRDIDGDDLTFSIDPAYPLPAGLSIDVDTGMITGTIDSSASQGGAGGVYTVTVNADDGQGGVTPVTFVITVTNPAPIAGDDANTTAEDTAVSGTVAGNDSDPDGDALAYAVAAGPLYGAVALDPSTGDYTYTPDAHYHGVDSFTYTVTDADGASRLQTVTITVTPVNDAPDSTAIAAQTSVDSALIHLNVAANFSDVDGTPLAFSIDPADPLPPGLSIDPVTGLIAGTIDHLASQSGPYTVTVIATDPDGATTSQTFTWTVTNPAPVGPVLPPQTANDGTTISLPVSAGFADPDGDTLSFSLSGDLPAGFAIDPVTGVITGTWPNDASVGGPASNGVYAVTVTATDSQGASVAKTFAFSVLNPGPTAGNDSFVGTEDMALSATVIGNDSDPDADDVTYALVSAPAHGTITFNPDGTFTYYPDANYNALSGVDSFTYSITDAQGQSATATVTLTIDAANDAPGPLTASIVTTEDTALSGTLPNSDIDGDTVMFALTTPPTHGTVTVNADGTYTYTPSLDYVGLDSFVVELSDGSGGVVLQTVSVTVTPLNDAPVATNDSVPVVEDTPATGNVLTNDTDIDGDPLSVTQFEIGGVIYPADATATLPEGTLVIDADGSFTFTPTLNYNGPVPVATYTITDGTTTDTATLTLGPVSPVNDAPVATNDSVPVVEDTPATGNVLTNDSDVDGNPLSVTQFEIGGMIYPAGATATLPEGTLVIDADGSFTFTPTLNYNGPVPVATYTITDGTTTDTATLTLGPVSPVNDAPVATNDSVPVVEDTPATGNVLTNDSDVDGNPLSVTQFEIGGMIYPAGATATLPEGTLVIDADGSFTFMPTLNYNGPVPVATYTITDGTTTDTATLDSRSCLARQRCASCHQRQRPRCRRHAGHRQRADQRHGCRWQPALRHAIRNRRHDLSSRRDRDVAGRHARHRRRRQLHVHANTELQRPGSRRHLYDHRRHHHRYRHAHARPCVARQRRA